MSDAKLIINSEEELELVGDYITIGRASDNSVSFAEDSNVSRYHAEIEKQGEEDAYWIFDLNSSNGTTLNGEKITTEKPLYDGDTIVFGGTSEIKLVLSPIEEEEEEEETEEKKDEAKEDVKEEAAPKKSRVSLLLIVAGLALGLAVICVFAAGIYYWTRGGGSGSAAGDCQASAKISSPQNGDFLKKPSDIEIDLENGECVQKVTFLIDGEPFATAESSPFSASIDPAQFPDRAADGLDHKLSLVLEDDSGNKIPQQSEIALALETVNTRKPDTTDDDELGLISQPTIDTTTNQTQNSQMSLIDTQKMTKKVVPQFAGRFEYKANNQSFLQAVRKMTAEYVTEGYYERARQFSDIIAKEYIQNRDLDPPLGYILAMSRTKFQPANKSDGAGLWKMDNSLVLENGYNGSCEAETIAAPTQKCAAIASSIYVKDIVRDVFEGDIIYGVAAFGMSKNEAAQWKATLPPPSQRKDFWNVIKSPKQREEIVRFFAAATVAENPQKFGLKKDRPLSELYRGYMQ